MRIVFFNGGLANQVFQYIFYRYGQMYSSDEEWYLDDSFFFVHQIHNGYELERVFDLHPNLLSEYFDPDVWDYMISVKRDQNVSIPQIMKNNDIDIKMIIEADSWNKWNPFDGMVIETSTGEYAPQVLKPLGDIYYHGYWITSEWFHAVEDTVRSELSFPKCDEDCFIKYDTHIRTTESCSIHIRRGDYVNIGLAGADEFYLREIRDMLDNIPNITLFVFSDDISYCKKHAHDIGLDLPGETIFVEGNQGETAYRDLQLMSHCKYMINGNSSFCYLAALLNTELEGIINPTGRKL